jgi:hypothetical protein
MAKSETYNDLFRFVSNKISFLFTEQGVMTLIQPNQDAYFENNVYSNIFSYGKGSILSLNALDQPVTAVFLNESYYNIYSNDEGLFSLESKTSNVFTMIFLNCKFKNFKSSTDSPLIFGSNVRKAIIHGSTFTFDIYFMVPNAI